MNLPHPMEARQTRWNSLLKGICLLLTGVYLINCLSPLRLHVDMIRYFGIKDCLEIGCPPDSDAAQDYMPYGYTALLLALSKLGLLRSYSLILINSIYLFAGLLLVKKIFSEKLPAWIFFTLVLLNWTTIKFVTHPLSEMQYLFLSCCSLFFFNRYTKERSLWLLVVSFVSGGLAFLTRTVGITLFAALPAGLAWLYRKQIIELLRKNRIWVAAILLLLALVAVFSRQLGLTHYSGVMSNRFNKGVTHTGIVGWHFREWAEIGFNTSIAKVSNYMPHQTAELLFLMAGIGFFATFLYVLWICRQNTPPIVTIYLLFYATLMFNWPFYDPRFWVPVLPLIIAVALTARPHPTGIRKFVLTAFVAVYVILGSISVGYMTYTSLNKKVFARTQANGAYRNEYEQRFYGHPLSDTAKKMDPVVESILQRYN